MSVIRIALLTGFLLAHFQSTAKCLTGLTLLHRHNGSTTTIPYSAMNFLTEAWEFMPVHVAMGDTLLLTVDFCLLDPCWKDLWHIHQGDTTYFGNGCGGAITMSSQGHHRVLFSYDYNAPPGYTSVLDFYVGVPEEEALTRLHIGLNLGGCLNNGDYYMRDDLGTAGLLPASEPYTALGFAMEGGVGFTCRPQEIIGYDMMDDDPVDWILVELRDPEDQRSWSGVYPVFFGARAWRTRMPFFHTGFTTWPCATGIISG